MAFNPPTSIQLDAPLMGYRFGVYFMANSGIGVAHPADIFFMKVSGIGVRRDEMEKQGTQFENLVLERGLPIHSNLSKEVLHNLKTIKPKPTNILISLLDEQAKPVQSWIFKEVVPVSWSVSPFNANANEVVIERMEFRYKDFDFILL